MGFELGVDVPMGGVGISQDAPLSLRRFVFPTNAITWTCYESALQVLLNIWQHFSAERIRPLASKERWGRS